MKLCRLMNHETVCPTYATLVFEIIYTIIVLKFRTLFSFCSQIKHHLLEMFVRIANSEGPDQQSDLGLHCLSWSF